MKNDSEITKHYCKQNDNVLQVCLESGDAGEIQVSSCLEKEWLIIGMQDIRTALRKAGYKVSIRRK